ncbi:MAG: YfhO family protein [Chlorobi bacterium]|nr:YfhO family protein [Chlorobiota bacterium]
MKREKRKPSNIKYKELNKIRKPTEKKITEQKTDTKIFPFNVWILSGIIILIGFFAFSKYLTGEYLFFFKDIGSDSINQNYPAIIHKINLLKDGFFSKWSFYKGVGDSYVSGIPVEPYGLFRSGIDYAGASFVGANFFIFGRFLRIFIFYFLFTGIIAYFYFRTLSVKKFAAVIGALLLTFSGYMVVGAGWGFSSHIFKAIFLLLAFEQLYLKKRWFFFPFAIIWLSSNPFVLFIYTIFLLLYSLFRYFSEQENGFTGYLKLTGKMILLGFIGVMMNFANLFKAFLKMYYSPRVVGDASYSNLLSSGQDITEHGNLGATTILRFFSSDMLGCGSNFHGWFNYLEAPLFYIGLLTLLLFPQIFIHLNKRKKIIFGSFLGFWALTLFFPYLRYTLLAFTGDYFRYGFDFFIPFTLLLFAVLSLNEIDKTFKINIPLLTGTFVVLMFALFFPYTSLSGNAVQGNLQTISAILLAVYTILLLAFSKLKYKIPIKSLHNMQFCCLLFLSSVIFHINLMPVECLLPKPNLTKTKPAMPTAQ